MKLIIEIPDSYNLDGIRNGSIYGQLVLNAVKNGIPIPDNATNMDMLKAIFDERGYIALHDRKLRTKWLFEPYQKGGKNEVN